MDYSAGMELFNKILKTAVDGGASDIHIKIGTPVIFRINRELISIECPASDGGMDEQGRRERSRRFI